MMPSTDRREWRQFVQVPVELVDNRAIPALARMLWVLLERRANYESGVCDPSLAGLGNDLGVTKPTVLKMLEVLETHGLVEKHRGQHRNRYTVLHRTTPIYELRARGSRHTRRRVNLVDSEMVNQVDSATRGTVNDVDTATTHIARSRVKPVDRQSKPRLPEPYKEPPEVLENGGRLKTNHGGSDEAPVPPDSGPQEPPSVVPDTGPETTRAKRAGPTSRSVSSQRRSESAPPAQKWESLTPFVDAVRALGDREPPFPKAQVGAYHQLREQGLTPAEIAWCYVDLRQHGDPYQRERVSFTLMVRDNMAWNRVERHRQAQGTAPAVQPPPAQQARYAHIAAALKVGATAPIPGTSYTRESAWQATLRYLQAQMTRANFDMWFPQTVLALCEHGQAVVVTPDEHTADSLRQRWRPMVAKHLAQVLGVAPGQVEVEYVARSVLAAVVP